jgi:hypothetical protein
MWPRCPLTVSTLSKTDYEKKFIGMWIENPLFLGGNGGVGGPTKPIEECCRFVFYKEKSCSTEKAVVLDWGEMMLFVESARSFLAYFSQLDGKQIIIGDALPDCPKPVILQQTSPSERIVFLIDGWKAAKRHGSSQRFLTTVSLKKQTSRGVGMQRVGPRMQASSSEWESHDFDAGLTITGTTLFYVIEACFENVLMRIVKNVLVPFRKNFDFQVGKMFDFEREDMEDLDDEGEEEEEEEKEKEPLLCAQPQESESGYKRRNRIHDDDLVDLSMDEEETEPFESAGGKKLKVFGIVTFVMLNDN